MTAEPNPPTARRRKPFWRRLWFWCLMVPVGFYVYAQWEFHRGGIVISRDYVAELNARIPDVPEDQQAWPVYRETDAELEELAQPIYQTGDVYIFESTSENWPRVVKILNENQELLDRVREAAARPVCGYRLKANNPEEVSLFISAQIEHLPSNRHLNTWVLADAEAAWKAGDYKRSLRDIETAFCLARHTEEIPMLASQLMTISMESQTFSKVRQLATEVESLPGELLDQLSTTVEAHRMSDPDYEVERFAFYDIVQHVYTHTGQGNGYFVPWRLRELEDISSPSSPTTWDQVYGPIAAVYHFESRKQVIARYDALMEQANARIEKPCWERGQDIDYEELFGKKGSQSAANLVMAMMFPALDQIAFAFDNRNQSRTTTLTLLAIYRYKNKTGSWPRSLDEIVPEFLPEVPICSFTGKPLGLVINDAGPVVYSFGADMVDDGGTPMAASSIGFIPGAYEVSRAVQRGNPDGLDGDWILWPEPTEE